MKFANLLFAVAAVTLAALPARAQIESREGIALQNQISELRRDIDAVRENANSGGGGSGGSMLGGHRSAAPAEEGAPNSDLIAGLVDRQARLEDAVRVLNGRLDELANAQQREHDDVAKQFADLQFRLDNGGGAAAVPMAGKPGLPPSQGISPPAASLGTVPAKAIAPTAATLAAPRSADQMIQEGNAALARRDYVAAEQAAREVLATKASPRGYDAQFLLAQSLSAQRRSLDAAIAYGDLYQRSKQGTHAQDALLGLANSQAALGDKHSACVALESLTAQFPSPRPDIVAHAAAARSSAGCR